MEKMWIGDQLPTVYDVAIVVSYYATSAKYKIRKDVINQYVNTVRELWVKSFTEQHVLSRPRIIRKIEEIMKNYDQFVKYSSSKASLRTLRKSWRAGTIEKTGKRGPKKDKMEIASLFDIGKDTKDLKGNEKIFYEDQRGARRHLLSHEIDIEYEAEQQQIREEEIEEDRQVEDEMSYIDEDAEVLSPPSFSSRSDRRHLLRTLEDETTDSTVIQPQIRQIRNVKDEVLDALASVSSKAAISVEKSRVAAQVICEKWYGHRYELKVPDEAGPSQSKKPRTADDYKKYEKVLPSARSINKFKHKKALLQEMLAAKALASKKPTTKVTLHFDTTQRSRIDGDWPSLILNFMDDNPYECRMISLRPFHFAYEDRSQIVSLIVETLKRLSVAGSKLDVSPVDLWQKIDAIMTDAVSKNLKIGEGVADEFQSSHVPYHILCKSHTCERLDNDNITTLAEIESKIGLRELILQREPQLKSFLRSSKCIVLAALDALLKLVATGGDGKTTSLAAEFDLKLEEAELHKSFSLYKEKRFTRMGYQAGAVYECIPYFKQVLAETPLNNLLVRACRIYLENDFIMAGLKSLANFTYKVTMPYLNFVEKSDQNALVEILPKLHQDFLEKKNGYTC